MRRLLPTIILLVLAHGPASSEPLLEVPDRGFDFGDAPQKATLVHRFWFKSVGTDTVRIHDIKTGCDCAVPSLEKKWIAPNDSMEVTLYWDISKYQGSIARTPRVFSNAGQDPVKLRLSATASIAPGSARPLTVNPYKFELAKSSRKVIDSLSFLLANHSERDISIRLVSRPVEECELVLPDKIDALGSATGYILVKSEFRDKEFKASVTLLISDGDNRDAQRLTVPIRRKFYGVN
jgi:hypothetical protein